MSPTFLNSNSTSHTWPFSAVAELLGRKTQSYAPAEWILFESFLALFRCGAQTELCKGDIGGGGAKIDPSGLPLSHLCM